MGRATVSPIWTHFEKKAADPSKVLCKLCKQEYSRGSTIPRNMTTCNLWNHLKSCHLKEHDECKKIDAGRQEAKRKELEESSAETEGNNLRNKKAKQSFLQETLPESIAKTIPWKADSLTTKEGDRRVMLMIINDEQPFTIVNDGGFLQLLKWLQPKFSPKSDKFYREMMQDSYDKCLKQLKDKLETDKPTVVSLMMDGWSTYHNGYMGVNVTWIDTDWKRITVNIACTKFNESHTAEKIASFLEDLLLEWGIYGSVYIPVTDSAANMVATFNRLPFTRADCGNHSLQCVIKDHIFSLASIENLCTKCRTLGSYFNRSNKFAQALFDSQLSQNPSESTLGLI